MTLNDLIKDIPEADRDLPVCLYTGWEGHEHLPAGGAGVVDCEYIDEHNRKQTGRHIIIET